MEEMPKPADLTTRVLIEIRNENRKTNARLEHLEKRIVESELRTATALAELAGSVREMTRTLRASSELRPRLEKCEREIAALKRKVS